MYSNIDKELSKKFWDILRRMGRGSYKRYNNKCEKEVFVRRTLNKWIKNSYFAVVIYEGTGIHVSNDANAWYDSKETKVAKKHYVHVSGCAYYLGHGEEVVFYVNDAVASIAFESTKFDDCSINGIDFKMITKDKYHEIKSLFEDDRDIKSFTFNAFHNKEYTKSTITSMGRDYQEARASAVNSNPEYMIGHTK